ncbi:MAG: hypothetical protein AAFR76_11645 [Planctomycetota bacterium]
MTLRVITVGDGLGPTDRRKVQRLFRFSAFDIANVEATLTRSAPARRLLSTEYEIANKLRPLATNIASVSTIARGSQTTTALRGVSVRPAD